MRTVKFFVLLTAGTLFANPGAADWPRWRGPDGTGVGADSPWRPAALAQPRIQWKASIGQGYSSVAVSGRYVYAMGNTARSDTVVCLDIDSGERVWAHSYPCALGSYPGPRATPTVDDGTVYTLSREGHLFALDAATGRVKWQKHLANDFGARPPQWDFAGSVVVAGDRLVINAGQAGLALDKRTGTRIWDSGRGPGGYATPVLYESGGRTAAAIFGREAAYGVDVATGAELWSFDWSTSYDVNAADPVIFEGKVFVSSAYDKGSALFDVSAKPPRALWRSELFKTHFSSFVRIDNHVYGIDGDARQPSSGVLRSVDLRTGRQAWSATVGFGSLIAAGGRLIVLTSSGSLVAAEATPTRHRELARGALPRDQYWTPPALAHGRLFVRNLRGDLFAIDLR